MSGYNYTSEDKENVLLVGKELENENGSQQIVFCRNRAISEQAKCVEQASEAACEKGIALIGFYSICCFRTFFSSQIL